VCIASQADAILSKLQTISNQEKDDEQKILIAADTVCLAFFFIFLSTQLSVSTTGCIRSGIT